MQSSDTHTGKPIGLDDLIALNEEIAALVRAGVPLELGLTGLGTSLRGRLARIVEEMALRMSRGASLPDAIAAEGDRFPTVYRAVVEAGLKAGRLPEALESLAVFSRSLLDVRRRIGLALLYPMIVLAVAYGLFVGFVVFLVPGFETAYYVLRVPTHNALRVLQYLHATAGYWGPVFPALYALFVLSWFTSRWSVLPGPDVAGNVFRSFGWMGPFGWLPWPRRILRNFQLANFADLLGVLLDHRVPLPEAMLLAGRAAGDARLVDGVARISADLQSGRSLADSLKDAYRFPQFMRWMMSTGENQGALPSSLRQVGEIYRSRAARQADWFKLLMPIALVMVVGGGATLLYALTLFLPFVDMLRDLS